MDKFIQWLKTERNRFNNLHFVTCQKIKKKEQLDTIDRMTVKLESVIKKRNCYVKMISEKVTKGKRD